MLWFVLINLIKIFYYRINKFFIAFNVIIVASHLIKLLKLVRNNVLSGRPTDDI